MEQRQTSVEAPPVVPATQSGALPPQNPREAFKAREEARKKAQATVTLLRKFLQRERESRAEKTQVLLFSSGISLALILFLWFTRNQGQTFRENAGIYYLFVGAYGVAWLAILGLVYQRNHPALDALSPLTEKQQIGVLIQTLQARNGSLRTFALQNLLAFLPTLHAGDTSLLQKESREILLHQLTILPNDPQYRAFTASLTRVAYRREMNLRLAILQALEQVGGEQELAVVEGLAQGHTARNGSLRVPAELREAAQACLPYLQIRAEDQRASAQLLRASSLPASPTADLLRPAATGASAAPEQLLRASEPDA